MPAEYVREVDKQGRIVIPVDIRSFFKINFGDRLEISADRRNGEIIIKKPNKICSRCGADENLKEISRNYYLCSKCIEDIK